MQSVASLIHYTQIAYLPTIVGNKGRGLILGGVTGKGDRTHVYASTALADKDGTLPSEYQR